MGNGLLTISSASGQIVEFHALKAKALLSGSDCGRGFGSVFRLQGTNGRNGGLWAKRGDICSGY